MHQSHINFHYCSAERELRRQHQEELYVGSTVPYCVVAALNYYQVAIVLDSTTRPLTCPLGHPLRNCRSPPFEGLMVCNAAAPSRLCICSHKMRLTTGRLHHPWQLVVEVDPSTFLRQFVGIHRQLVDLAGFFVVLLFTSNPNPNLALTAYTHRLMHLSKAAWRRWSMHLSRTACRRCWLSRCPLGLQQTIIDVGSLRGETPQKDNTQNNCFSKSSFHKSVSFAHIYIHQWQEPDTQTLHA